MSDVIEAHKAKLKIAAQKNKERSLKKDITALLAEREELERHNKNQAGIISDLTDQLHRLESSNG